MSMTVIHTLYRLNYVNAIHLYALIRLFYSYCTM